MTYLPIYDVRPEIHAIYELVEAQDGEIFDDQEKLLKSLQLEREELLWQVGVMVKNLDATATAYEQVGRVLLGKSDRAQKRADFFKHVLSQLLNDGEKFSNSQVTLSWRTSKAVEVEEGKLPDIYIREVTVATPNKAELKKDLEAGAQIEGARLVTRKHLQVK